VLGSALLYIGSITGWVLMYIHFGHAGCPAQQTVISLTLILCVALTGISCSRVAPHGTLLTSAAVTAYATYLCYSTLASHPDDTCNPMADSAGGDWSLVVAIFAAGISLSSMASSLAQSKTSVIGTTNNDLDKPLDGAADSSTDEEEEVAADSWWSFHLMMLALSLYYAMLLTDWSSQPAEVEGIPLVTSAQDFTVSLSNFWVKFSSLLVALLIYGWTLLAPYAFRESRDFGVEFDF